MPPKDEKRRAYERLNAEAPLSSEVDLHPLQQQAADYIREAKAKHASKPQELVFSAVDAIMRNYFRYELRKKRIARLQKPNDT